MEVYHGKKRNSNPIWRRRIPQRLRGLFFQKLQDKGLFDGSVVIVQPIEKGMCSVLEQQGCEYNLFLRGIDNGQVVDEHTHIDIISRCVNPYDDLKPT